MHQLLSFQQFNEAKVLLSKSDQQSRLRGLALVLHGNFNAVGWPYMDADLMPIDRKDLQAEAGALHPADGWGSTGYGIGLAEAQPEGSTLEAQMSLA
ncbi:hypothetical protein OEZ86_000148 [Tetradesmus obliquus]|nr:hypothetical protein OEZ86_000148 [Tetradesmus obliquus]